MPDFVYSPSSPILGHLLCPLLLLTPPAPKTFILPKLCTKLSLYLIFFFPSFLFSLPFFFSHPLLFLVSSSFASTPSRALYFWLSASLLLLCPSPTLTILYTRRPHPYACSASRLHCCRHHRVPSTPLDGLDTGLAIPPHWYVRVSHPTKPVCFRVLRRLWVRRDRCWMFRNAAPSNISSARLLLQ